MASTWPTKLVLIGLGSLGVDALLAGILGIGKAVAGITAVAVVLILIGMVGLAQERARGIARPQQSPRWPPGPEPFRSGDRELFELLGRERELADLQTLVEARETKLIAVTGPAGQGKTSLLRAGLLEALKPLPVVYWNGEKGRTNHNLWRMIASSIQWPADRRLKGLRPFALDVEGPPRVVVVDDFDQMDPDDAAALLVLLRQVLAADEVSPTSWVLAFDPQRSDTWGRFESQLTPALRARVHKLPLKPLPVAVAEKCLFELGKHYGLAAADSVVRQLALDLRSSTTVRPLRLGICFQMLTQAARHEGYGEISAEDYREIGGVAGLLRRYLDQAVTTEIPTAHRAELIKALVALCDLKKDMPLPHGRSLTDLSAAVDSDSWAAVKEALASLAVSRARILTAQVSGPNLSYRLADLGLVPALRQLAGSGEGEAAAAQRLFEIRYKGWLELEELGEELREAGLRRDANHRGLLPARDLRDVLRHKARLRLDERRAEYLSQSIVHRRLRRARLAGFVAAAGTVLLAAHLGIVKWRERESLLRWSLPVDLGARQGQLQELDLPGVNDLRWLDPGLDRVLLSQTTLENLRGLPAGLEQLGLCGVQLRSPSRLPAGLQTLDARGIPPQKLGALPEGLRELQLAGYDVTKLPDLPPQLERLTLQQTDLRSLTGIRDSVTSVHLSQGAFVSLKGLPPDLERLVLDGTRVEDLSDLPSRLRHLELRKNPVRGGFTGLPSTLESLVVEGGLVPTAVDLGELPSSLLEISLVNVGVKSPELLAVRFPNLRSLRLGAPNLRTLPPLPATLRSLAVTGAALDSLDGLPPQLADLTLNLTDSAVDPHQLPRLLRRLTLLTPPMRLRHLRTGVQWLETERFPVADLRPLPPSVTHMTARWSQGSQLAELPPRLESLSLYGSEAIRRLPTLPASLKVLDLRGTRITSLTGLPGDLRELNIFGLPVSDLSALPPKLEVLHLKPGQVARLDGLPASVHTLRFVEDQSCVFD